MDEMKIKLVVSKADDKQCASATQKAIRAYRLYLEHQDNGITMEEAAAIVGSTKIDVSRVNTVAQYVSPYDLDRFYETGSITINGKRTRSIQIAYKMVKKQNEKNTNGLTNSDSDFYIPGHPKELIQEIESYVNNDSLDIFYYIYGAIKKIVKSIEDE